MHPLQLTGRAWGHQFVNWNSAQAHGAIATTDRGRCLLTCVKTATAKTAAAYSAGHATSSQGGGEQRWAECEWHRGAATAH